MSVRGRFINIAVPLVICVSQLVFTAKDVEAQVWQPYGAHRGRIVIRPWVQKIYWGNGLTPYGAATVQQGFVTFQNIATDPGILNLASTALGGRKGAPEERAAPVDPADFEAMRKEVAALREKVAGQSKAETKPAPPESPTVSASDALEAEIRRFSATFGSIRQDAAALRKRAEDAKSQGESLRQDIKTQQEQLKRIDTSLEKAVIVLDQLMQGLDSIAPAPNPPAPAGDVAPAAGAAPPEGAAAPPQTPINRPAVAPQRKRVASKPCC